MAKKLFPKALSVGLSLSLCAGLVAPSFAATFTELNNAINGNEFKTYEGNIIASQGEDGGRVITLGEKVECIETDTGDNRSIIIKDGKDITIDLNGNDIVGKEENTGSSVIWVDNGSLTLQDNHEDERPDGKVTSSSKNGVWVDSDSSFTMEGGEISGNWKKGPGSTDGGAGVCVEGGKFEMTGGKITSNTSEANGGGVLVKGGGTFEMTGGEISGNTCNWGDAVSVIGEDSTFTMSDEAVVDGEIFVKLGGSVNADSERSSLKGEYETEATNSAGIRLSSKALPAPVEEETEPSTPDPVIVDEPEVEIDDVAVPLAAGPVTCAEFIDYLWRHEDEPEADLVVDHEYAEAISWALSIEIIDAETFEADELVTVAAVRDILASFAAWADMDVNVYALASLTGGDDDEAVLNCDEVLAEFFGE